MPRLMCCLLPVSFALGIAAEGRGAEPPEFYAAVMVVDHTGATSYRVVGVSKTYLPPEIGDVKAEAKKAYDEAVQTWQLARKAFKADPANSARSFLVPRPSRPVVRMLSTPDRDEKKARERIDMATREAQVESGPKATKVWYSGFENGLREFGGSGRNYVPGDRFFETLNDASCGFGILNRVVYKGKYAYAGWVVKRYVGPDKHRAYPGCRFDAGHIAVNSFMVYLEGDYEGDGSNPWIHLATWTNTEAWNVFTTSVVRGILEVAHMSDVRYHGPRRFPMDQWVRITMYCHLKPEGPGLVYIWVNGKPTVSATFSYEGPLIAAHWGMYAAPDVTKAVQYNDEIQIWSLDKPWTDFDREPPSPWGPYGPVGPGATGNPPPPRAPERKPKAPPKPIILADGTEIIIVGGVAVRRKRKDTGAETAKDEAPSAEPAPERPPVRKKLPVPEVEEPAEAEEPEVDAEALKLFKKAETLFIEGQLEEATAILRKIVDENPGTGLAAKAREYLEIME